MLYKAVLTFNSADEAQGGAIEVKATEQYLHVILFVILHKIFLTYNLFLLTQQEVCVGESWPRSVHTTEFKILTYRPT